MSMREVGCGWLSLYRSALYGPWALVLRKRGGGCGVGWFPISTKVNIGGNGVWHCDNISTSHTCRSKANIYQRVSIIHHEASTKVFRSVANSPSLLSANATVHRWGGDFLIEPLMAPSGLCPESQQLRHAAHSVMMPTLLPLPR